MKQNSFTVRLINMYVEVAMVSPPIPADRSPPSEATPPGSARTSGELPVVAMDDLNRVHPSMLLKPFEGQKKEVNRFIIRPKTERRAFTEEENVQSIHRIIPSSKGLSELRSIWQIEARNHSPNT